MTARDLLMTRAAIVVAALAGIVWLLWPEAPVVVHESAAPAETQADGSVVIERADAVPPAQAKPVHKLPAKAKAERVVQVTVQPSAVAPAAGQPCPPVTVDLTLARLADGSRRVVTSSPMGAVVAGLDVPAETIEPPHEYAWAAGLSLDPIHQTPGVWMDRTWRRLRVGVEINQVAERGGGRGGEIRVRAGVVW